MEKINDFEYSENDVVITFTNSLEGKDTLNEKYTFQVKNDPGLTFDLLLCIKEHEVPFRSIFYCAHELFRILRKRDLTPLPTPAQKHAWHEQFKKKYHQPPVFTHVVSSTLPREICAILTNVPIPTSGTARDLQVAKALALKDHLGLLETPVLETYSN